MSDIQKLSIQELELGMYVVEIEKGSDSVRLKAGGKLIKNATIERMRQQNVSAIYVDFSRSDDTRYQSRVKNERKVSRDNKVVPLRANTVQTSFKQEMETAEPIFEEAKELQQKLFDVVLKQHTIDLESVEEATSDIMQSMFRNPDALLLLTRLKNKGAYLFEHAVNSSILMTAFATHLEYDERLIHEIAIGSFMHDIGKILVPKSILDKPGKLTDEEFTKMKKHVDYSNKILEGLPSISPVSLDIVSAHHERLDHSGYPCGLRDEELTTWGRMIAIVDTYDAMTADRCYKKASMPIDAFKTMMNEPEHYDNELVQRFIKIVGIYPVGSLVKLKSGALAMVHKTNKEKPLKPLVASFYNCIQEQKTKIKFIDLAKISNEEIDTEIDSDEFDISQNPQLFSHLFQDASN